MRSRNERLGIVLSLLIFVVLAGVFSWSSWRFAQHVVRLEEQVEEQGNTIRRLTARVENQEKELAAKEALADSIQTTTSSALFREQTQEAIQERDQKLEALNAEVLRQTTLANSEVPITAMETAVAQQNRNVQQVEYQLAAVRDQLTIYQYQNQMRLEERRSELVAQREGLALRIQQGEQVLETMMNELAVLRAQIPPPAETVARIRVLETEILAQRQDLMQLRAERQSLAQAPSSPVKPVSFRAPGAQDGSILEQPVAAPFMTDTGVENAWASSIQDLQALQARRQTELEQLQALQRKLAALREEREEARRAAERASDARVEARAEMEALQATLQERSEGAPVFAE